MEAYSGTSASGWEPEVDDHADGWDSGSDHDIELSDVQQGADRAAGGERDAVDDDIMLLKEKLASIPQSLHQEGFNALKEILDFLETEDLQPQPAQQGGSDSDGDGESRSDSESGGEEGEDEEGAFKQQSIEGWLQKLCTYIDEDWETVIDNHFTGFNYCIKSFSNVVKPKVGETLEELKLLKQKLDKAKLYAGSRTTDLKDKHLKRIQHTEMLRILGCVEELSGVVPQLDGLLRRRAFLAYVRRLNWALKMIMGEDMANIGALAELREQLLERKNSIHQILLDQLQNLLFLRQFDDPQAGSANGGGGTGGEAGHDGVDYLTVLSRRDVRPRLPPDAVSEQYHSVRRQLSASGSNATPQAWRAASGARAAQDDMLLKELAQALDESLVAPLDISYERIVRAIKVEIKRMLHESADVVGAQERARRQREADRQAAMASSFGGERSPVDRSTAEDEGQPEDGLNRPNSQSLVTLMEMAHQMYIVVFFNMVRFSSVCEQLENASSSGNPQLSRETRMYALAETWRDMQNTVELFVLKHFREPVGSGEGTYTTQELFSGTFSSKLSFNFNSVHTTHGGVPMSATSNSHENEDYAGAEFVQCSPYHIMAIYMPMQEFAEAGLNLLTATGMDMHLARGSHLLPTFLDDFITHTFLLQIVEDSNRLCSVATQAADAFLPPPTPSRAWQRTRAPLQSCVVVTRLIKTLYQCMRAIPTHADLFLTQVTNLISRYASECRRQIELGSRYSIAYQIICPTKEAAAASAAAVSGILQAQSNRPWRRVLREREMLELRNMPSNVDRQGGEEEEKPEAFSEIEALSGALFNSEFAALSAALHEHEHAELEPDGVDALSRDAERLMTEGQCTLLANVVDALAFLCEQVSALERAFLQSGALAPELVEAEAEGEDVTEEEPERELTSCLDEPEPENFTVGLDSSRGRAVARISAGVAPARSVAGKTVASYTSLAQKTMLSALRSGASIVGASGLVDDISDTSSLDDDLGELDNLDMEFENGSFPGGVTGRGVALARCWVLHDRFLIVLRTELRCQCFFHLKRTRNARYDLRTAPVNPEEFIVAWNRALERRNALIKTYLSPAKHAFVLSGLPSTMAAILTTYSGVDEGEDVTPAGVMQMRRNVFALQNLVKVMHVGSPALQAEDIFLDTLMRKLVAHHDKLMLAAASTSTPQDKEQPDRVPKLTSSTSFRSTGAGRLKRLGSRATTRVVSNSGNGGGTVRSAVAQATVATGRLASGTVRRLQGGEV